MGAYETTVGPVGTYYVARAGQTPVSPYTTGWAAAAATSRAPPASIQVWNPALVGWCRSDHIRAQPLHGNGPVRWNWSSMR
jgi:hypothetical protein